MGEEEEEEEVGVSCAGGVRVAELPAAGARKDEKGRKDASVEHGGQGQGGACGWRCSEIAKMFKSVKSPGAGDAASDGAGTLQNHQRSARHHQHHHQNHRQHLHHAGDHGYTHVSSKKSAQLSYRDAASPRKTVAGTTTPTGNRSLGGVIGSLLFFGDMEDMEASSSSGGGAPMLAYMAAIGGWGCGANREIGFGFVFVSCVRARRSCVRVCRAS